MHTNSEPASPLRRIRATETVRLAVVVGALGVVFGDIGTSPIYTIQTVFNPGDPHPVPISTDNVYGVVSLIFWSVMIIVTLTYVTLVMRADNNGEGGIMALITLLRRWGGARGAAPRGAGRAGHLRRRAVLRRQHDHPGDLGAVGGRGPQGHRAGVWRLDRPDHRGDHRGAVLRAAPRHGGRRAALRAGDDRLVRGDRRVRRRAASSTIRRSCKALSPTYALTFMVGHFHIAFFALAAIVLAVTGAEALYADMGHFGRRAITRGWLGLVLPACTLSYFGQGALVLGDEGKVSAPFFLLTPSWARLPMVLLATAATVIASQAVITGAYLGGVAGRSARLPAAAADRAHLGVDDRPDLRAVDQRAADGVGADPGVRVPQLGGAGVRVRHGGDRHDHHHHAAVLLHRPHRWRTPLWLVVHRRRRAAAVDLLFLAANLTKLVHGAWLPLLIAVIAFTVMTTWQRGREIVTRAREQAEGPLREFIDGLADGEPPLVRVPGTAVFLNRGKETAPLAMRANVEHNHVLPRARDHHVDRDVPVPRVPDAERIGVDDLGYAKDGIIHVTARFGYMETPNVPAALRLLDPAQTEGPIAVDDASYFLSKLELTPGTAPTMAPWRKRLFIATSYITADAAEYFGLPRDRTVIMGSRIEV